MTTSQLPNEYFIGRTPNNIRAIVIKRKPSQIPHGIDNPLCHICGITLMDGPNDRVYYECDETRDFGRKAFDKMTKFLNECGWSLKQDPIDQ